MKVLRYFAVLCALLCVCTMSVYADDWYWGEPDDLTPETQETSSSQEDPNQSAENGEETTQDVSETTTEEETTEPETTTEEDTTEPEESGTEDATTAPAENESTEQPSEQVTGEPGEQTTEQVTEDPTEQGTEKPAQSEPAGEQTTDEGMQGEDGGLPIPLPVILGVLAVLGVGGVVACVFIMKKFAVK
ncbi:MAG: hypothetical protein IJW70_06255 [Clostridia bacterium]|nr:hypothetical protein [Clostridia bacterium]